MIHNNKNSFYGIRVFINKSHSGPLNKPPCRRMQIDRCGPSSWSRAYMVPGPRTSSVARAHTNTTKLNKGKLFKFRADANCTWCMHACLCVPVVDAHAFFWAKAFHGSIDIDCWKTKAAGATENPPRMVRAWYVPETCDAACKKKKKCNPPRAVCMVWRRRWKRTLAYS